MLDYLLLDIFVLSHRMIYFCSQLLRKPEYFGKYGKIIKVIVNPSTNYAGPQVIIYCGVFVGFNKLI